MVEIEMPCCGTTTRVEELTDEVGCETCNLVLDDFGPDLSGYLRRGIDLLTAILAVLKA